MRDPNGNNPVRRPSASEIVSLGSLVHLELTRADAEELSPAIDGLLDAWNKLQPVDGFKFPPSPYHKRDVGGPPNSSEDPWNAFIRMCDIPGADSGRLVGKTVGVKDNIDVAGV